MCIWGHVPLVLEMWPYLSSRPDQTFLRLSGLRSQAGHLPSSGQWSPASRAHGPYIGHCHRPLDNSFTGPHIMLLYSVQSTFSMIADEMQYRVYFLSFTTTKCGFYTFEFFFAYLTAMLWKKFEILKWVFLRKPLLSSKDDFHLICVDWG